MLNKVCVEQLRLLDWLPGRGWVMSIALLKHTTLVEFMNTNGEFFIVDYDSTKHVLIRR